MNLDPIYADKPVLFAPLLDILDTESSQTKLDSSKEQ